MRAFAFALVATAACGSSSAHDGTIDCSWIQGNNCWKQVAAAATACLPAASEIGALDSTSTTCTFASGDVVTSTTSLIPASQPPTYDFTVTSSNQQTCVHWESGAGAGMVVMQTTAGTITATSDGTTYTYTCPDGSQFSADEQQSQSLLACAGDAGIAVLPGHRATWSNTGTGATHTSFWIDGTDSGELQVYSCQSP